MSTYQKCPPAVEQMANGILCEFDSHKPLLDARVKIDFIFAYPREKSGTKVGNALSYHGVKALGMCCLLGLKDRAMGRGDAEILIDGDWWASVGDLHRRSLLDHELHHLEVKRDRRGMVRDDLNRPVLRLRKHDVDVGWFAVIAARHKEFSVEVEQARVIMDNYGQLFWPRLMGEGR